jgi:hypothetical protein
VRVGCLTTAILAGLSGACDVRDETVHSGSTRLTWPADHALAPGPLAAPADLPKPPGIEYVEGYEAGSHQAAASGLPLLLVFRASWCRWSSEMARGPLADPALVEQARRFVCVTVDADRDAATCRAFEVTAFPTIIIVDADGRERYRASGAAAVGGLATALERVLDPTSGDRVAATPPEPRRQ